MPLANDRRMTETVVGRSAVEQNKGLVRLLVQEVLDEGNLDLLPELYERRLAVKPRAWIETLPGILQPCQHEDHQRTNAQDVRRAQAAQRRAAE